MARTLIPSPTETVQETFANIFVEPESIFECLAVLRLHHFYRLIIYQEHYVVSFSVSGCMVRSLRGYWLLEIMKLNLVERLNY